MNVSVLIGTILFHITGLSLFVALIVELWRYFMDKVMLEASYGKVDLNSSLWEQIEKYSILRSVFHTDKTLCESFKIDNRARRRMKKYLMRKKIINGLLILKHYLLWGGKLLLPNFLVGSPSLFDNINIVLKENRFKPLRRFIFLWFIFGILFLIGFVFVF